MRSKPMSAMLIAFTCNGTIAGGYTAERFKFHQSQDSQRNFMQLSFPTPTYLVFFLQANFCRFNVRYKLDVLASILHFSFSSL
jgi:hypothetical protein